jgi:nitroreductase
MAWQLQKFNCAGKTFSWRLDMVDSVLGRRSIRKYQKRDVDNELVRRLLTAAMSAPSAEDERPWHFAIIRDQSVKAELAEVWLVAHIVNDAPLVLVVCGDESLQKRQNCWMLDCAAATENILIEAHNLGLGGIWLGVYPVEGRIQRVRSILHAPQSIIPFALVPIGYPGEIKEPLSRYDDTRVHDKQW